MEKTFKELNKESKIDKEVKKAGLSLAIIFSREDIKRYDLEYNDIIRLDNAEIIKKLKAKDI